MTRYSAFAVHLIVTLVVVGVFLTLAVFVWYPFPYMQLEGAGGIIAMFAVINLILGPMLTLIVFKPGKYGLKFDMVVIIAVQLAAFLYGAQLLFGERPGYAVFVVDRFEVAAVAEIDSDELQHPELAPRVFGGPLLVFSRQPDDPEARSLILMDAVSGGRDMKSLPEYYKPYAAGVHRVLERAMPLQQLLAQGKISDETASALLARHNAERDALVYVPLVGSKKAMAMVLDGATALPLDVLDVDPWP